MSLAYLFRRLAKEEMGFLSAYERNYAYKLIDLTQLKKHYDFLQKRFTHWKREHIEKSFSVKKDDRGRDYVFTFGRTVPCYLESNFEKYPLTKGFALVPRSVCAKCPHLKTQRRKRYCEKLREKNKGLTEQVITGATKKVEEWMK